jgi:hypothetical protein
MVGDYIHGHFTITGSDGVTARTEVFVPGRKGPRVVDAARSGYARATGQVGLGFQFAGFEGASIARLFCFGIQRSSVTL